MQAATFDSELQTFHQCAPLKQESINIKDYVGLLSSYAIDEDRIKVAETLIDHLSHSQNLASLAQHFVDCLKTFHNDFFKKEFIYYLCSKNNPCFFHPKQICLILNQFDSDKTKRLILIELLQTGKIGRDLKDNIKSCFQYQKKIDVLFNKFLLDKERIRQIVGSFFRDPPPLLYSFIPTPSTPLILSESYYPVKRQFLSLSDVIDPSESSNARFSESTSNQISSNSDSNHQEPILPTDTINSDAQLDETMDSEATDASTCSICLTNVPKVFFIPCQHLVSCISCSKDLQTCPMCRGKINQRLIAFTS